MFPGIPRASLSPTGASLISWPQVLFITTSNTIFMARNDNGQILIWRNSTGNPTTTIVANLSSPGCLFFTNDEQIFVDGGSSINRVDRWMSNGTRLESPMSLCSIFCPGMFVDLRDNLYCSQYDKHQVSSTISSRRIQWNRHCRENRL